MEKQIVSKIIEFVVSMLYNRDMDGMAQMQNGRDFDVESAFIALDEYPGSLSIPPKTEFEEFSAIEVVAYEIPTFHVDFDLWMDGEKSDLTLQLIIQETSPGKPSYWIEDLHVL